MAAAAAELEGCDPPAGWWRTPHSSDAVMNRARAMTPIDQSWIFRADGWGRQGVSTFCNAAVGEMSPPRISSAVSCSGVRGCGGSSGGAGRNAGHSAPGYDQPNGPVCAFVLVDLEQAFAKRVYGYADNGVGDGIEVRPPAKGLGRDGVFLDLIAAAREVLFADVLQHARQVAGAAKDTGREEPVEFPSFGLGPGFCGRNVFGSSNSSHERRFYTP